MASRRPQFRTDIEGLRGIAILLVVLFHAGVSGLAGGFVGVDVFFVLSGYFISGLLWREMSETGGVALSEFYGRRALRLLPSLLLVLVTTLAAVMWLYAPIDRASIAASARSVALSSGNVEFARGAVDYFSAGENPLLHTWSLAVEEQFYLVWPLLFLLVVLIHRRRDDALEDIGETGTQPMLLWVGFVGVLSLAASIWLTESSQSWAFFGMPTRLWEFALGGSLALMLTNRADAPDGIATVLQLAGLLMIGYAVVTYDRATPYPGVAALMPALGGAALIVGGARAPGSFVSRKLSWEPLRALGRLSYAWYLWHWPLVGIGAVLDRDIGVPGKLAWSAVALVAAWITHRVVEGSAQRGRLSRFPTHWLAPAAFLAGVGAALMAHGAMRAAERGASRADQRVYAAARVDRMSHGCWASTVEALALHERAGTPACEFGDLGSRTTIALLGDSHAEHWLGGLDTAGKEYGWKIVAMVKGGCPVADVAGLTNVRLKRYYYECTRYREAMVQRIIALRPSAVILSSWDHYIPPDGTGTDWQLTPDVWRAGLHRTYARLSAAGIPVVAIRGTPRTWFDVPSCLSRYAAKLPFARVCDYDRDRSLSQAALSAQNEAARGLPVRFVDMNDQICAAQRCGVVRNGVVVFTDDNHLTASFSRSVGPILGKRISAALAVAY